MHPPGLSLHSLGTHFLSDTSLSHVHQSFLETLSPWVPPPGFKPGTFNTIALPVLDLLCYPLCPLTCHKKQGPCACWHRSLDKHNYTQCHLLLTLFALVDYDSQSMVVRCKHNWHTPSSLREGQYVPYPRDGTTIVTLLPPLEKVNTYLTIEMEPQLLHSFLP